MSGAADLSSVGARARAGGSTSANGPAAASSTTSPGSAGGSASAADLRTVKIALLGFGNVAREFCALAARERASLAAEGLRVLVAAAGTRHASFLEPAGVEPGELLARVERAGDRLPDPPRPADELLRRSNADLMVEATVMEDDGAPVASGHIETAFRLGMDVITVNKGPVAWQYDRLQALAGELGRRWRFEGTVADGMPVFGLLDYCLRSCRILGFEAIFNATGNFIIEAVGEGRPFDEALAQVQAEGYAEADPSHDIDGVDGACKTAALANVAMGAGITPAEIPRDSIRGITPEQVRAAAAAGRKLCVLCTARRVDGPADPAAGAGPSTGGRGSGRSVGHVEASVRLTEIPLDHPLAPVKGSSLGVLLHTDLMADVVISEMAALVPQTAYAVYADLLALRSPVG